MLERCLSKADQVVGDSFIQSLCVQLPDVPGFDRSTSCLRVKPGHLASEGGVDSIILESV